MLKFPLLDNVSLDASFSDSLNRFVRHEKKRREKHINFHISFLTYVAFAAQLNPFTRIKLRRKLRPTYFSFHGMSGVVRPLIFPHTAVTGQRPEWRIRCPKIVSSQVDKTSRRKRRSFGIKGFPLSRRR